MRDPMPPPSCRRPFSASQAFAVHHAAARFDEPVTLPAPPRCLSRHAVAIRDVYVYRHQLPAPAIATRWRAAISRSHAAAPAAERYTRYADEEVLAHGTKRHSIYVAAGCRLSAYSSRSARATPDASDEALTMPFSFLFDIRAAPPRMPTYAATVFVCRRRYDGSR